MDPVQNNSENISSPSLPPSPPLSGANPSSGEGFYQKYKFVIVTAAIILVGGILAYYLYGQNLFKGSKSTAKNSETASQSASSNSQNSTDIEFVATCSDSDSYTSISEALKDPESVCSLDLSGQGLTAVPAELSRFTKIKKLIVNDNKISTLPPDLFKVQSLMWLHLNKNLITSVPAEIKNLTNLEMLSVGENNLSEIPSEVGQLTRLRALGLSRTKVTTLPQSLTGLSELKVITIVENNLSDSQKEAMKKLLPNVTIFFELPS